MKLVSVRVESNLKKIVEEIAKHKNLKMSDIARELIEIGTTSRETRKTTLKGSLGLEVPFEDIDLGGDQERLNLYIGEEQFRLAQEAFGEQEQAVLRKALRLGVFYVMPPINKKTDLPFTFTTEKLSQEITQEMSNKVEVLDEKSKSLKNEVRARVQIRTVESYVITDGIKKMFVNQFFPNLNLEDNSTRPILVSGHFGSGKSHLTRFIAAIAEDSRLLKRIKRQEIITSAEIFAGRFIPVFITYRIHGSLKDSCAREVIKKLYTEISYMRNFGAKSTKELLNELMNKFEETYSSKGLLVIIDLEGIDETEDDLQFIQELIAFSRERRLKLIVERGLRSTLEKFQDHSAMNFTEIHLDDIVKDVVNAIDSKRSVDRKILSF